jgi:hypothetical protein
LQPFNRRKRYRRRCTSSLGQVRPFTTIALPKNSGFQIGGTSLGPPQAGSPQNGTRSWDGSSPSKNARLSG